MSTTTPEAAPTDLTRALRRRWWLIVLVALIGAGIGGGGTVLLPKQYSASVTLVVQLPKGAADTEALVRTVEALTTSRVVLGDIATNSGTGLSPNEVQDRLQVDRPSGSAVIEVKVVDTSLARARAVATQVVPALQQRIAQSRSTADETDSKIAVESFGGGAETERVVPPLTRNIAIGGIAGFAAGLLLAVASAGRAARRRR